MKQKTKKPKLTKLQAAKNVFAKLGLPWQANYDGSNGGTVTADAWRKLNDEIDNIQKEQ